MSNKERNPIKKLQNMQSGTRWGWGGVTLAGFLFSCEISLSAYSLFTWWGDSMELAAKLVFWVFACGGGLMFIGLIFLAVIWLLKPSHDVTATKVAITEGLAQKIKDDISQLQNDLNELHKMTKGKGVRNERKRKPPK